MARPIKKGLDYFPLDTNLIHNIKIRKIMKACGAQAIAVLVCLLGNIYGDKGYYMQWDDDTCFLVADDTGASEAAVQEVVVKAVQVKFFDKYMLDEHQILTSEGVQERYRMAAKKKKDGSIEPKFQLPRIVSDSKNGVSGGDNPVMGTDNPQSKLDETKPNENKDNPAHSGKPKYVPTDRPYLIAKQLFEAIRGNNSEFKPKFGEKDLQRWANDIRLAHEQDGREYDKLAKMVDWCQADSFWQTNILSGAKLRAKFDQMAAQANAKAKQKSQSSNYGRSPRKEVVPSWAKGQTHVRHITPEERAKMMAVIDGDESSGNAVVDMKRLAERVANLPDRKR